MPKNREEIEAQLTREKELLAVYATRSDLQLVDLFAFVKAEASRVREQIKCLGRNTLPKSRIKKRYIDKLQSSHEDFCRQGDLLERELLRRWRHSHIRESFLMKIKDDLRYIEDTLVANKRNPKMIEKMIIEIKVLREIADKIVAPDTGKEDQSNLEGGLNGLA